MLPTACLGREMRSLSSGDRPCGRNSRRNCPKKATYPKLVLRDELYRTVCTVYADYGTKVFDSLDS